MLKERFGWDGPPDGKKSGYDYLPLVVQADPDGEPELFEVPLECAPPVHVHHPRYPGECYIRLMCNDDWFEFR